MLRSIQAAELPPLELYPKADQVTFRYYTGLLSFLNEQYGKAEEELLFALSKCPQRATRQVEKNKMYFFTEF